MKMEEIPWTKKTIIFCLATSLWFILIGLGLILGLHPIALGIALLLVGIPTFIISVRSYE